MRHVRDTFIIPTVMKKGLLKVLIWHKGVVILQVYGVRTGVRLLSLPILHSNLMEANMSCSILLVPDIGST